MKFVILGTIIVVHLVVLAFLMGPCKPSPPPAPAAADEDAGSAGGETAAEPDAPASVGSPRQYHAGFYAETLQALPDALNAASNECSAGIVVDWTARTVLWKKRDTAPVPIASLTKMMTVLLLMESLEEDQDLTLQTPVRVTRSASKVEERQVWLDPRETFTLDDLLKATLIRSANDTAYLIGEFLAGGSHGTFVERMNRRARELGLSRFAFLNAHGLPEGGKENQGCPRELSYLAGRLLEYPQVLKWSQTKLEYLHSDLRTAKGEPFMLTSTNKLLGVVPGVNGMKTGFTNAAGWCMATTCERNGRVIIVVVTGCEAAKSRDALVKGLVEWAYRGN